MRTIYIDSEFKCHVTNDGTMTAVYTDFFNGKCDAVVEGYCYKITDTGTYIYPWKPHSELDAVQRQYEREQLLKLETYQIELNTSYTEGVNSI